MTISSEYRDALTEFHERSNWGVTGAIYGGPTLTNLFEAFPEIETILDYGCGEGALKKYFDDKGVQKNWTLYDPGMPQYKEKPKGTFDLVITTDVLEHVEPHMMSAVLKELSEYSNDFLYNDIACYLTNKQFPFGPYIGQDLHINLEAPDTWRKRLQSLNHTEIASKPYIVEEYKVRYLSVLRKDIQ